MYPNISADKLLDGSLSPESSEKLMSSYGFQDWLAAQKHLQYIYNHEPAIRELLVHLLPHLLVTLSASADPDQALINFERFVDNEHTREIFEHLTKNPRTIEILVTIFAGSQFLTEILLRDPRRLDRLIDREIMAHKKTSHEFLTEAMESMHANTAEPLLALRQYQKGELLRIGTSDLLSLYDLPTVTMQLSNLADAISSACLSYASIVTNTPIEGFVVLGMGKLGGGELNYSSDIDLLFICSENGHKYLRLGQVFINSIADMSAEGFLYRVDMRLRPWGRDGALVSTVDGYLAYLQQSARTWEKQALLKARPIAGDIPVGDDLLKRVEPIIFNENPETLRANVQAMKQRTEEVLRSKGREWGEVKLGEGSIRDVEFVVQYLQLVHGGKNIKIRRKSTLQALRQLQKYQILPANEVRILTDGYIFQRTVEHFLQMMHYRQTYTLPADPVAIHMLARRLGFSSQEAFLERYQQNSTAIRMIYAKHILGQDLQKQTEPELPAIQPDIINQHIARMDSSYTNAFSAEEISLHATLADQLNEDNLVHLVVDSLGMGKWQVTVVAYDYLGELSLICGLMFVHGLDIHSGEIFTYESGNTPTPEEKTAPVKRRSTSGKWLTSLNKSEKKPKTYLHNKIVDVFTVQTTGPDPDWEQYTSELKELLQMLQDGKRREARSLIATRVGALFAGMSSSIKPLLPIQIEIDNNISEKYSVLHITTTDAVGFLYEFTNALSLTHTNISRMAVHTDGGKVDDLLYVTNELGTKISDPEKLQELRAAAVLIKHFTHLLPRSSNPATALLHFREFLAQLFERQNWTSELTSLENPQVMDNLAQLLGVSDFLWDDFLRMQYANLFPVISTTTETTRLKNKTELQTRLTALLNEVHSGPEKPADDAPWKKVLNAFKDREMFRIDMRHILGLTEEFWDFSEELTDLSEVIVNTAYYLTEEDLRLVHGTPRLQDGSISQMAIVALGKCGGRELGFASDIELMFIYEGEGFTDGPEILASSVYHEKVVQNFLWAIKAKQEGIFQIDLQLRPYGKAGSLAVSLDSFRNYYAPNGAAWAYERQALVKMRAIAGDSKLGATLEQLRDTFIYGGIPFDVTAMRAMRERQVRHLVSAGKFNAKYSPGGLVDIEYLIQAMQITYGAANPKLRHTNIRKAMTSLNKSGHLSNEDYIRLHKAHTFLRWLIDSMRVVRGNSKDVTIPTYGSDEFAFLSRRLKYGNDVDRLRDDLLKFQADVVEINRRLLQQIPEPDKNN